MMRTEVKEARDAAYRALNVGARYANESDVVALAQGFLVLDREVKYDG